MGQRGLTPDTLAAVAGDSPDIEFSEGRPRVAPATAAGIARLLRVASAHAWRVQVIHDAWLADDADVDLLLSTKRLSAIRDLAAADLVISAGAGATLTDLRDRIEPAGLMLPADPPGEGRTLGGALSTGTAGPLRAGYGGLRDQILGLTVVTGDGRTMTLGGRVVKNVAGYDMAKLHIGGFSAFGVIVAAHIRLRAAPPRDVTATAVGPLPDLLAAARGLLERGAQPVALEVIRRDDAWTLAIRFHGLLAEVDAGLRMFANLLDADVMRPEAASAFWSGLGAAQQAGSVTLRVGVLPDAVEQALAIAEQHLPRAMTVSITVWPGALRWSGDAPPAALIDLRRAAAGHEMPVTIERAPGPVRASVGIHGAYRDGVQPLVDGLRAAFDPAGILHA